MPINKGATSVDINKRRIINGGDADVMQLYPMRHTFAWDAYTVGNANHWLPTEISMQRDIEQWKSQTAMTSDERKAFESALFRHDKQQIKALAASWAAQGIGREFIILGRKP